jgi:DNA-binding response OmpR family regulator
MENGNESPVQIILVLERQHIVGFDLIQSLKDKGYNVVLESDFKEAQSVMGILKPDFIIAESSALQELLPEERFEILKRSYHLTNESMIVHTKELDILAVFEKPFNSNELVQFLNKHLNVI